uniref:Uncharacterized protein n=1 Tax=Sinocyclocheilus anshuiensis TaxID=1608454 RepID=A0A671STM6_9TELE
SPSTLSSRKPQSERDDPFQQILHQIGGKSNIHLISAVRGPDGDTGALQDFIADMFNNGEREETSDCTGNSNGEIKSQTNNKTVSSSRIIGGKQRAIKCSVIIFLFKHDYACDKENQVCLREILKDVRARIKRNALRPALLGLVHTDCDQSASRDSVELLDRSLRAVFTNHPPQAIWTGRYVTKSPDVLQEIRWNTCRAVTCSMSAGQRSKPVDSCSVGHHSNMISCENATRRFRTNLKHDGAPLTPPGNLTVCGA